MSPAPCTAEVRDAYCGGDPHLRAKFDRWLAWYRSDVLHKAALVAKAEATFAQDDNERSATAQRIAGSLRDMAGVAFRLSQ